MNIAIMQNRVNINDTCQTFQNLRSYKSSRVETHFINEFNLVSPKIRYHAEKQQFASENSTDFSVLFFNRVCDFYFLSERHIFVFAVNVFVSVVDIFVIGIFAVFKRHIVIARRRDIVIARCGCVVKRHWLVA